MENISLRKMLVLGSSAFAFSSACVAQPLEHAGDKKSFKFYDNSALAEVQILCLEVKFKLTAGQSKLPEGLCEKNMRMFETIHPSSSYYPSNKRNAEIEVRRKRIELRPNTIS
jgi:hypothetical protein